MDEIEKYGYGALGAIALSKILHEVYSDTTSPSMKKVGAALASVVDFGLGIIKYPVDLINEKRNIRFAINIKRYQEKIATVPDQEIVSVAPEIAQPLLERLAFSSNEALSEAFISLLTAASNSKTANIAHPAFIYIIDRLCPDEAKILKYFGAHKGVGYVLPALKYNINQHPQNDNHFKTEIRHFKRVWYTDIDFDRSIFLHSRENVSLYMDNLISLGLVSEHKNDLSKKKTEVLIENYLRKHPKEYRLTSMPEREYSLAFDSGHLRLTSFGELFLRACDMHEKSNLPENYDETAG